MQESILQNTGERIYINRHLLILPYVRVLLELKEDFLAGKDLNVLQFMML
jgi:hypothetical protein